MLESWSFGFYRVFQERSLRPLPNLAEPPNIAPPTSIAGTLSLHSFLSRERKRGLPLANFRFVCSIVIRDQHKKQRI